MRIQKMTVILVASVYYLHFKLVIKFGLNGEVMASLSYTVILTD